MPEKVKIPPELLDQFKNKLRFRKKATRTQEQVKDPSPAPSESQLPLKEQVTVDAIKKSQQDPKSYRSFILPNGIKATVISDPTTSKSAACMTVEVGHMADPEDVPGLAHLCEHALFLGSKKYPTDNDFRLFLSENGGFANAQTFADVTKYFFDIVPERLADALDRFSQMFIEPLFDHDAISREIVGKAFL
jgi:insulysin